MTARTVLSLQTRKARGFSLPRGFSLLEVLLAITLLALLIAGAYSGIRAAANAMRAGEAAIDRADRLRTAQEFLRHQLSRILPLAYAQNDADGSNYVFEGKDQFMRFVAPMPGYLSRGGPYVQTLELARGSDGLQLRFNDAMLNGFDVQKSKSNDAEAVVLLDHIRDGRFEYRTLDDQGELTNWSSDWSSPGLTPLMVRIRLNMQPGVQIPWPVLDVPLMLNAGAVRPSFRPTMIRAGAAQ
jgi:general secretion pathway protein J